MQKDRRRFGESQSSGRRLQRSSGHASPSKPSNRTIRFGSSVATSRAAERLPEDAAQDGKQPQRHGAPEHGRLVRMHQQ